LLEITALLHQGCEETRVISAVLHEGSAGHRPEGKTLQRAATQMLAPWHTTMDQLARALPAPEGQSDAAR
jgi:hypothetical protein